MKRAVIYLRVSTGRQAEKDIDAEGFSIPSQREACIRKATDLGAEIVDEYVDAGESARSADRPALQQMLERLATTGDIHYVLVFKVDRLARNRADDVTISLAIRGAGAQLVSCSESIDETPSGKLMHGIHATFAEYYSANLAADARRGMAAKAKKGVLPGRAPIGYMNVRERYDGREIRSIALDPDRAHHITWAYHAYASGEYTLTQLTEALEDRGLTNRPTRRHPAGPVGRSTVGKLLENPFYTGIIEWNGERHEGRHEPLIDPVTFQDVQQLKAQRTKAGPRTQSHHHYLRDMIYCGSCGHRLGITYNTGNGGTYGYLYCRGRQMKQGCDAPHVRIDDAETQLADHYRRIQHTPERLGQIEEAILDHFGISYRLGQREIARQETRLQQLATKRHKTLDAYRADAISIDLLKQEQNRIDREEADAHRLIRALQVRHDQLKDNLAAAIEKARRPHEAYAIGNDRTRRSLNQTFFEKIYFHHGELVGVDLAAPYAQIITEDLETRITAEATALRGLAASTQPTDAIGVDSPSEDEDTEPATYHRGLAEQHDDYWEAFALPRRRGRIERPRGVMRWECRQETENERTADELTVCGSNNVLMVGAEGLEPPTSSL